MYVNNKADQAKAMLTKYHGEGNPESAWVKLQLSEYAANLDMDGADKRWWDYRALFKDKYARYRLFCCCLIGVFGQFAGNGNYHHYFPCPTSLSLRGHANLNPPSRSCILFHVFGIGQRRYFGNNSPRKHDSHQLMPAIRVCHLRVDIG